MSRPLLPLSAIVAIGSDGSIGDGEKMPWHLPDDFKWFKEKTLGHTVIMGRKTFLSIGRPLPRRTNIVLTRNPEWSGEGVRVAGSWEEAIAIARAEGDSEPFVIGGRELFAEVHPVLTRLYITEVDRAYGSPLRYPEFDRSEWREVYREHHPADERHEAAFDLTVLERV